MIHADYFAELGWPGNIVSDFEEKLRIFNPAYPIQEIYFQDESYLSSFGLEILNSRRLHIDFSVFEKSGPINRLYVAGGKATMCLYDFVLSIAPYAKEVVLINDLYLDKDKDDKVQYYAEYYARKFGGMFPNTRFGICQSSNLDQVDFFT